MVLPKELVAKFSTKPHDALCKVGFQQRRVMRAFLRERLPSSLVRALRLDTARLIPTNQIGPGLEESYVDIAIEVQTHAGQPRLIFVLIEHKSDLEADVPLQLLKYRLHIYEYWRRSHPTSKLPPVFLVVLYHGEDPWTRPVSFNELIDNEGLPDDVLLLRERWNDVPQHIERTIRNAQEAQLNTWLVPFVHPKSM